MASTNFINECKNRANANRLGKIIVDGIETPITNSNNLQSFEIDSGCYVDGNIIGSVYAKCLKANFIDDQNNLTDKSIQAQIGVKYADLSNEYINMGKYTVERPDNEITANMSQITAYDDLYTNLDKKYVCNIDYSSGDKTVSDLYADVCEQLGLTPVTTKFTNSTILITDNPFTNGETNRTVLQTIAKISCSFVDIDNDTNKIDLCWLSQNEEPDYIFYKSDYSNVEGGKIVCGPINCLIIKNSQIDDENVTIKDDESIATNGEHSITISEDYILYNAELRQQAINAIWNKVKGMKYVDCKLTTYYGKPFLKLGKYIRVYISETEYFDTYVLKHNFTFDGTFTSVIESPALTKQEIRTKQNVDLKQALKNTQIIINKQEQKIKELVEETTDNSNKISEVEQSVDKISQKVSEIADLTREISSNRYVEVNDAIAGNLISLTISGEMSILPSKNIYPSKNLFPHDAFYLKVTNGEESIRYKLPFYVLHRHGDVKDEFIIDNCKTKLIKRIGVDKDDNKYVLTNPIEQTFDDITIPLTDGYNKIELVDFSNAMLNMKYAIQSEYSNVFTTKAELSSSITQTKDEINLEVKKKVDDDEIISTINQSAEQVKIKASKIGLEGYTTINEGFSVDEKGNATMNNATVKGGKIELKDTAQTESNPLFTINGAYQGHEFVSKLGSDSVYFSDFVDSSINTASIGVYNAAGRGGFVTLLSVDRSNIYLSSDQDGATASFDTGSNQIYINSAGQSDGNPYIGVYKNGSGSSLVSSGVWAPSFNNTSTKEVKKNIRKLTTNALKLITSTDLYKYNYKDENNKDKKHIGIVIGDGYNYPEEILSSDGKGVDLYSMVSVCFKAIQEQQVQIQELKDEINKLKEGDK